MGRILDSKNWICCIESAGAFGSWDGATAGFTRRLNIVANKVFLMADFLRGLHDPKRERYCTTFRKRRIKERKPLWLLLGGVSTVLRSASGLAFTYSCLVLHFANRFARRYELPEQAGNQYEGATHVESGIPLI